MVIDMDQLRLKQQQLQYAARMNKLSRFSWLYFFNFLAIFILQIIAIYFFKTGFLLSRSVLPNVSDLQYHGLVDVVDQTLEFYNDNWSEYTYDGVISLPENDEILFKNLFQIGDESIKNDEGIFEEINTFKKAVWIIIDALRFDFTVPINTSDPEYNSNYHNNFKVLYDTIVNYPQNAALFKFLADPPTTTLQRLKGLTTGSLPTFIDAGSNFDGDLINEDNLIFQFFQHNKKISLLGDDTWINLFEPYLNMNMSYPYESLNVWDIHTVDNGVIEHIHPLLENEKEWDMIVGHFLGLDHVGHRYGPDNFEMVNKQKQMHLEMKKLIDKIDDDTLLVVMGDHGMDPTGNHGGDSQLELESTLFLYSKKPVFPNSVKNSEKYKENMMQNNSVFNLEDIDNHFDVITQIDFVPTFSLFLNLPIPFNNLGKPINKLFAELPLSENKEKHVPLNEIKMLLKINFLNILNLQSYKLELINQGGNDNLKLRYLFKKFLDISTIISNIDFSDTNESEFSYLDLKEIFEKMLDYQNESLDSFREIWATFNNCFIYIGLLLLAASLLILIIVAKIIPSIVFNQLITEFLTFIVLITIFFFVSFNSIFIVFSQILMKNYHFNFLRINLLAVASGIIMGFLLIIFDRYNISWLTRQLHHFINDDDSSWSFISIMLIFTTMVISYSSNSFIIFQDSMINTTLILFGFYNLYINYKKFLLEKSRNSQANSQNVFLHGIIHSVSFIIIQKVSSLIRSCREEQLNHCPKLITTTGGLTKCQTLNNFTLTSIAVLTVISLIFPDIIIHFLKLNQPNNSSYQGVAKFWIGTFLRICLFLNILYWFLDYIESDIQYNRNFFSLSFDFLKGTKLTIARLIMGTTLIAGNFAWQKSPLCLKIMRPQPDYNKAITSFRPVILGINNIYGSSYLLLVLNFFCALLITNKPYSSVALILLMYQILNVLELLSSSDLRSNMIGPIIFNLLGYSFFYSTDHQITLTSIKWELGFQLVENIILPLSQIPIILNSFSSFILISLSVVLITVWKIPPAFKNTTSLLSRIVVNCLSLIMTQTIITLSSLFFTNWFKRHLMVWKVFVPCFLFNSLILVIMSLFIILVAFFFGISSLVFKTNRIFSR